MTPTEQPTSEPSDRSEKLAVAMMEEHPQQYAYVIHEAFADLEARLAAAEDKRDEAREAHQRIVEWADAYPLSVFPEPDFKKAAAVLKAAGMTLDAISASNMRHCLKGAKEIACTVLATDTEGGKDG